MRDLTREFGFINHYRTSLQNLAARLKSSSGFQTYCRLNGEESGENIVQDYLTDVYLLLGENFEEMSPETIVFDAKETWFVVMARK
ncbi:unnamed protein product [Allacma fusca]|uniref:Uncharacterized protein n=1 Tax=Allacma fusca TaxID=39272 RepID=A0A8J2LUY7_9HEXA|nr:unnamed protein product [Allacma fusca]